MYHITILCRCHILKLLKKLGKIINIINTTLYGNFLNRKLSGIKKIYRMFDSFIIHIVSKRCAGLFFKQSRQVAAV